MQESELFAHLAMRSQNIPHLRGSSISNTESRRIILGSGLADHPVSHLELRQLLANLRRECILPCCVAERVGALDEDLVPELKVRDREQQVEILARPF